MFRNFRFFLAEVDNSKSAATATDLGVAFFFFDFEVGCVDGELSSKEDSTATINSEVFLADDFGVTHQMFLPGV